MTDQMDADASAIIREIDDMGGVVAGINKGYFRRQIAEASYRFGQEMEAGDRIVVGMNAYTDGNDEKQVEILEIPHTVESEQCARLAKTRASRSNDEVRRSLDAIRTVARKGENVMPALVAASLARCTLGEQVQAMADVYGRYSGGPEW
jgi:methylmalonyl-CoA mutase N-terminal domain/subunit